MEKHVYVRVNGRPIVRLMPWGMNRTVSVAEVDPVLREISEKLLFAADVSAQEIVSWSPDDTTWMDRLEGRSEVRRPVLEGGSVDGT